MHQTKKEKKAFQKELKDQLLALFMNFPSEEAENLIKLMYNGYLHSPYADDMDNRTQMLIFSQELRNFLSFIKSSEKKFKEMLKNYQGISTDLATKCLEE